MLYNMGLFLLNYEDYENGIMILEMYKERVGVSCKVDELIGLGYLLEGNFGKGEGYVKRNVLRDPCHLKYRLQWAYVIQRKCQFYYEFGEDKAKVYSRRRVERTIR